MQLNFIILLLSLSHSAIFGVDFGSDNIKLGIALPGRIDVALNSQSKRNTPTYFTLYNMSSKGNTSFPYHWSLNDTKELEWGYSYEAQSQSLRYPQNIIRGMPNLFSNRLGLTGREIFTLMIRHLISSSSESRYSFEHSTLMFAVEPWLPLKTRYAIRECVFLGGSNIAGLIDSSNAAATTYGLERQSFFYNSSQTVLFIDIGQSHTWVSIYNFTSKNGNISAVQLSSVSNMTLGGKEIDFALLDHITKLFKKEHNLNTELPYRTKALFLREARKLKERLTISFSSKLSIEDALGDLSLYETLNVSTFDSMLQPFLIALTDLLDKSIIEAGINKSFIDSIELLGGSTRIPIVNKTIREWSGLPKLNRTLNSDEAICLGAGYAGAMKSNAYIIQSIDIHSFSTHDVFLKLENGSAYTVYRKGDKNEPVSFSMPSNILPQNFSLIDLDEGLVGSWVVEKVDNETESSNYSFTFGFDECGIPTLFSVRDSNGTSVNKTYYAPEWALSGAEAKKNNQFIFEMERVVHERQTFNTLLNDHESLVYKIRERLDSDDDEIVLSMTEEEKKIAKNKLEIHSQMIANESNETADSLKSRIKDLEKVMEKAEKRVKERTDRPRYFNRLNSTIISMMEFADETKANRTWVPEENVTSLYYAINQTKIWMENALESIKAENLTQDPIITINDINQKRWDLEDARDSIESIKKPERITFGGQEFESVDMNEMFNGTIPRPIFNQSNTNETFTNTTETNETFSSQSSNNETEVNSPSPKIEDKEL